MTQNSTPTPSHSPMTEPDMPMCARARGPMYIRPSSPMPPAPPPAMPVPMAVRLIDAGSRPMNSRPVMTIRMT